MIVTPGLITLTAHRWNLPVLSRLGEVEPVPFNDLVRNLSVSRDSLSRSLSALARPGWVGRRSSRYRLTPSGRALAPPCTAILTEARRKARESLLLRKWSLPVAAALEHWSLRFNELRALLGNITPRALTLALKEMQAAGLVHREVIGGFPPATSYRLTSAAERLLPPLTEIVRVHDRTGRAPDA